MKKHYPLILVSFICSLLFLVSCQTEKQPELNAPDNTIVKYITFELQNIDSVRYWGDSEKIRLQSGMIMLNPENHTYLKRFIGTADEALDPAQVKWSKEEPGKYIYSVDSTYLLFSNEPCTVYYFPGYWTNGIWHQPKLEQHDSVWYSISYFSMGVSGRFVYSLKPD